MLTEGDSTVIAPVEHQAAQATERRTPTRRRRSLVRKAGHAVIESVATQAAVSVLTRLLPAPQIQLSRHDVVVPRLPARLDGLRLLHVTDLHLHPGPRVAWQLPEIVATVPHDLLCYTGDFIDSDDDLVRLADLLARMPRITPAYAVLGNHDHVPFGSGDGVNDVRRLRHTLASAGITLLTNEARALDGGDFYLAGVDDPATGHDDLAAALRHVPDPAGSLLLAHSPDIVLRMGTRQPGVILAGHTHGGQIRLPFVGAVLTECAVPRRLIMGLHTYQSSQLFVSRGIGYSGLDLRLGCPPEVALLTLRRPHLCTPA